MDAEQPEFPDGAFDRVLCGFGVMFFPDQEKALSEFRRVLKPGGRIGLSTWRVSQAEELTAVLNEMQLGGPNTPGWITDPDELGRLLSRAGFSEVRIMADVKAFRCNSHEEYRENARGTGLRRRLAALDAGENERVRSALVERVAPYQMPDGIYLEATALLAIAAHVPN